MTLKMSIKSQIFKYNFVTTESREEHASLPTRCYSNYVSILDHCSSAKLENRYVTPSSSASIGVCTGNTVSGLTSSTVTGAALSSANASVITDTKTGSINMLTVKEAKIPELYLPQRERCIFFDHLAHILRGVAVSASISAAV